MQRWAIMVAAGLAALCAGCSSSGSDQSKPTGSATPNPSVASSQKLVESIALQTSDVKPAKVILYPHGNEVAGQVTLDNCGFQFTTESRRVARHEVRITATSKQKPAINEVVAYRAARHAAKALKQYQKSVRTCPHTPVSSAVVGAPLTRYTVLRRSASVPGLPVRPNYLAIERAATSAGSAYEVVVLQVKGRVLDAAVVVTRKVPTKADVDQAIALAKITGRRLAEQA